MSQAIAPGTPAPEAPQAPPPAPAPPPVIEQTNPNVRPTRGKAVSSNASERAEQRRAAILQKHGGAAPAEEPETGAGGSSGDAETAAPPPAPAANDNAAEAKPEPAADDKPKDPEAEAKSAERKELIQLSIQRRKNAERARKLEKRERDFAEQTRKHAEERERLENLKKSDPIRYAQEMGFSVKQLVEHELKNEKPEPKVKLEEMPPDVQAALTELAELKRWREEQTEAAKKREADERQRERDARGSAGLENVQRTVGTLYDAEIADYPHLQTYEEKTDVIGAASKLILSHFNATAEFDDDGNVVAPGEVLDIRQVLRRLESVAQKDREDTLARYSKPLRAPTGNGGSPNGQTALGKPASPEPKTLSHSDAASGAPALPPRTNPAEKKARISKRLANSR